MTRETDINAAIALIEDALSKDEIEERTESDKTWRPPGDNKLMLGETISYYQYRAKKQPREIWLYESGHDGWLDDGPSPDGDILEWGICKVREVVE